MILNYFWLNNTYEEIVLKKMTNIESSKAAGIDRVSSRFLKDGSNIIAKLIFVALQSLSLTVSLAKYLQRCETKVYF